MSERQQLASSELTEEQVAVVSWNLNLNIQKFTNVFVFW